MLNGKTKTTFDKLARRYGKTGQALNHIYHKAMKKLKGD